MSVEPWIVWSLVMGVGLYPVVLRLLRMRALRRESPPSEWQPPRLEAQWIIGTEQELVSWMEQGWEPVAAERWHQGADRYLMVRRHAGSVQR